MLRVVIVTQDDPFYLPIFFNHLLKQDINKRFVLKGIIVQPPLGKKSIKKLVQQMLQFYGFGNFIMVGVKYVVFKILGFIAVTIFQGKFPGVFSARHVILKKGYKVIEIKNINSREAIDLLKALEIDIIFSVAASQIFKKEILELPGLSCYNIHSSKLPKNRGMMPNFWSLYNYDQDPISAVTIHKMNEKLDDGQILIQQKFKLDPKEPLDKLIRRTKKISVEVFLKAIDLLKTDSPVFIENDSSKATYHTFPNREDVIRFESKGLKIL